MQDRAKKEGTEVGHIEKKIEREKKSKEKWKG